MKRTIRIILATLVLTGLSNFSLPRSGMPYWQTTGGQPDKKPVALVPKAEAYGLTFRVDRNSNHGASIYSKWNCQGHRQYVLPGHSASSRYIWWSVSQSALQVMRITTVYGMKTYPASAHTICRTFWTYSPYTNIKTWFYRV
jgi:hypothetical protein